MPLTPKTSLKRCCQSVSVVILDVTFKPHRAHDQACIAVIVLHSLVPVESAAKIDDLSLTVVASSTSSAVFSFDAPFGVFDSFPSVARGQWETRFEIRILEQRTKKKAAKTRQPDQQVLVSTFVQLKCLSKRKKKTQKKCCAVNTNPKLSLISNCLEC